MVERVDRAEGLPRGGQADQGRGRDDGRGLDAPPADGRPPADSVDVEEERQESGDGGDLVGQDAQCVERYGGHPQPGPTATRRLVPRQRRDQRKQGEHHREVVDAPGRPEPRGVRPGEEERKGSDGSRRHPSESERPQRQVEAGRGADGEQHPQRQMGGGRRAEEQVREREAQCEHRSIGEQPNVERSEEAVGREARGGRVLPVVPVEAAMKDVRAVDRHSEHEQKAGADPELHRSHPCERAVLPGVRSACQGFSYCSTERCCSSSEPFSFSSAWSTSSRSSSPAIAGVVAEPFSSRLGRPSDRWRGVYPRRVWSSTRMRQALVAAR